MVKVTMLSVGGVGLLPSWILQMTCTVADYHFLVPLLGS